MHSDSVWSGQTQTLEMKMTVACQRFQKFRLWDVTLVKVKIGAFIQQVRGPRYMLWGRFCQWWCYRLCFLSPWIFHPRWPGSSSCSCFLELIQLRQSFLRRRGVCDSLFFGLSHVDATTGKDKYVEHLTRVPSINFPDSGRFDPSRLPHFPLLVIELPNHSSRDQLIQCCPDFEWFERSGLPHCCCDDLVILSLVGYIKVGVTKGCHRCIISQTL
jgi:hypothetical protein